jgi:hypothetical protein
MASRQDPDVIKILDTFSDMRTFGDAEWTPLCAASLPVLSRVFRYYFDGLPEAPLESTLFRAFTDLCVIPSTIERRRNGGTSCSIVAEEYRIQMGKLLFRLLPPAHFASLVYILMFFSAVISRNHWNGITIDWLSDHFGHAICGPRDPLHYLAQEHAFPPDDEFRIGMFTFEGLSVGFLEHLSQDTLRWLLTYWQYISDGLLERGYQEDLHHFAERVESEREMEAHRLEADLMADDCRNAGICDSALFKEEEPNEDVDQSGREAVSLEYTPSEYLAEDLRFSNGKAAENPYFAYPGHLPTSSVGTSSSSSQNLSEAHSGSANVDDHLGWTDSARLEPGGHGADVRFSQLGLRLTGSQPRVEDVLDEDEFDTSLILDSSMPYMQVDKERFEAGVLNLGSGLRLKDKKGKGKKQKTIHTRPPRGAKMDGRWNGEQHPFNMESMVLEI